MNLPPSLPSGTATEEVLFYNRIRDDLPAEIKGRAFWNEGANSNISAYKLKVGDQYPITVEFINGAWYQIHWQGQHIGKYAVTVDKRITDPATVGLGTRNRPLLHAIDTSRIHHEPSESSTELEITFASLPTDEDEPITTLVEEQTLTDLSISMAAAQISTMTIPPPVYMPPQPVASGSGTGGGAPGGAPGGGAPGGGAPGGGAPGGGAPDGGAPGGGAPGGGAPGGGPPGGGQPPAQQAQAAQPVPQQARPRYEPIRGAEVEKFRGDRADAKKFMSRFGLWKFLNRDTRTVQVAADLVAYALTLISGPLCDRWARGIQDKLALKVLGNPLYHIPPTHADNDPALWDWFVREFTLQFTDSAEEENAFAALQKLELKENDADTYINRFIELVEKAQWGLDAPGTIRLFHDGLPVNMHRAICQYQHLPRDMQDWFEATREECKRYNDMAVSIGPRGGARNISTRQNCLRGLDAPKQPKRKDPNAMEVDAIKTGRLSNEEKAKLLKEGRCFHCKKMGHLSKNCPDKKDSKGKGTDKPRSSSGQSTKPKARATVINEDEEDEQQEAQPEEDDEALPSYTNKGIKEFIHTMKLHQQNVIVLNLS